MGTVRPATDDEIRKAVRIILASTIRRAGITHADAALALFDQHCVQCPENERGHCMLGPPDCKRLSCWSQHLLDWASYRPGETCSRLESEKSCQSK